MQYSAACCLKMRRHNERTAEAVPVDEVIDVSKEQEAASLWSDVAATLLHRLVMPMR
jgi:hypothetical protein